MQRAYLTYNAFLVWQYPTHTRRAKKADTLLLLLPGALGWLPQACFASRCCAFRRRAQVA